MWLRRGRSRQPERSGASAHRLGRQIAQFPEVRNSNSLLHCAIRGAADAPNGGIPPCGPFLTTLRRCRSGTLGSSLASGRRGPFDVRCSRRAPKPHGAPLDRTHRHPAVRRLRSEESPSARSRRDRRGSVRNVFRSGAVASGAGSQLSRTSARINGAPGRAPQGRVGRSKSFAGSGGRAAGGYGGGSRPALVGSEGDAQAPQASASTVRSPPSRVAPDRNEATTRCRPVPASIAATKVSAFGSSEPSAANAGPGQ